MRRRVVAATTTPGPIGGPIRKAEVLAMQYVRGFDIEEGHGVEMDVLPHGCTRR